MDRESHYILNYLDQPWRLLFLTLDEMAVLGIPLVLGFWHLQALWGLISAVFGFLGLRFLKKRLGKGNVPAALYWYFPTSRRQMKLFVPSSVRGFIG